MTGNYCKRKSGFTLAELLIALLVLGIISTFSIPKILTAQQYQRLNAVTKEDMSTIAQAIQNYNFQSSVTTATTLENLMPIVSYINYDTSSDIDDSPGWADRQCDGVQIFCWRMANGSVIWHEIGTGGWTGIFQYYDATARHYYMMVGFDPDGKYNGTKSLGLAVYDNGRISTDGVVGNSGAADPTWYKL